MLSRLPLNTRANPCLFIYYDWSHNLCDRLQSSPQSMGLRRVSRRPKGSGPRTNGLAIEIHRNHNQNEEILDANHLAKCLNRNIKSVLRLRVSANEAGCSNLRSVFQSLPANQWCTVLAPFPGCCG